MAFISSNYKPVFTSEAMPRLVTLYRAETPYTSMPRTMAAMTACGCPW